MEMSMMGRCFRSSVRAPQLNSIPRLVIMLKQSQLFELGSVANNVDATPDSTPNDTARNLITP